MGAEGNSSAIASSTFSPPRQVSSQSCTSATRAFFSSAGISTSKRELLQARPVYAVFVVKVLIDLRMVRGHLHGIARYALELARRLPVLEPGWQFMGLIAPAGLPDDLGPL